MFRKLLAIGFALGLLTAAADARRICPILCGKSATGPAPPAQQPLRSAVSRALVGQGFVSGIAAPSIQGQSRLRMYLGDAPSTELRVCYGDWGGAGEGVGPGNITIEAAIESDGPLGVVRALFSGANTITLTPGQTACSDAVLASSFGLTQFAADQPMWFRTGITAATSGGFPFGSGAALPGESSWAGPAFTSQVNATGIMTLPSGGAAVSTMTTPFAVLARYTVPMPTLCDVGDSISAGINDTAQTLGQGSMAGNGYVGRAAYNTYGTHIYPTFKMGIGGDGVVGTTPFTQRATFFQYCTHFVSGEGVNDVTAGNSLATILAAMRSLWALAHNAGIQNIAQTTITPFTTSTDGWLTTGSQTAVSAPYLPGGIKDQLNAAIIANVGSNFLTNYVNVGNVASGGTTDFWVNTDTQSYTPNVTVTSGQNSWTFSTGTFVAADIGKVINISGAGAAGATFNGHVAGVSSSSTITTGASETAGTSLVASAQTVQYGTQPTSDGLHPLGPLHTTIAPFLTTFLQSAGPQLPTPDNSWVPAGADWAMDFKNGRYYQINCTVAFCQPTPQSVANQGSGGVSRANPAYGVTANNATGTLIQFGPNTPRITPGRGLIMERTTTNLFASPFTPGSQVGAVSNATQYTISVVGTGSLILSGACTGTVTAGSPVTCTSTSTSLSASVSGTLLSMQLETGAVAHTPISGTRGAEDVSGSGATTATFFAPAYLGWFGFSSTVGGTLVTTVEGVPNSVIVWGSGSSFFPVSASPTTFQYNFSSTLTATLGAAANGHTVFGTAFDSTGRALDGNGGTIASDATANLGNGTNGAGPYFLGGAGSGGGSSSLDKYVQMLVHYPQRLTGATTPTFQQATTP